MSIDGSELAAEIVGLRLALAALTESLVRHDAIAYHQVHETLAEAIAALEGEAGIDAAVLRPLRQLAQGLDRAHQPTAPDRPRPHFDWSRLLDDIRTG